MSRSKHQDCHHESKGFIFRPSVRWSLVCMNLLLLTLMVSGVSFIFFFQSKYFHEDIIQLINSSLNQKQKANGSAIMHTLSTNASQAISGYEFTFLNRLFHHIAVDLPDIEAIAVMDLTGKVFAHSNPELVGKMLTTPFDRQILETVSQEFPEKNLEGGSDEGHYSEFIDVRTTSNGAHREGFHPVYVGNQLWGVLRCRFVLDGLAAEIDNTKTLWTRKLASIRSHTFIGIVLFFLIIAVISIVFVRFLTQSLDDLKKGVASIADGDLHFNIAAQGVNFREFYEVINSFNVMTTKLQNSYQQLDDYGKDLEKKVAARTSELKDAQAALLQQAHEAGMAEMAVGILHNIGNAITPAKINAMLLLRRLRNSPLRVDLHEAMQDVVHALEHPEGLPPEEKERAIAISSLIPETIKEEYDSYVKEIQAIYNKHEHIESIISLQMRYARLAIGREEVDINALADDALKMMQESITNRRVTVHKNLRKVPLALIEKGKMMQIVINLIKNAYEAMEDLPDSAPRLLEIATATATGPPDYAVLTIRDSGCGFAGEEKDNLFMFGYTTKEAGSGFGLHSCANYLIANNGSIQGFSDGKGKGATFVVKVPTKEKFIPMEG